MPSRQFPAATRPIVRASLSTWSRLHRNIRCKGRHRDKQFTDFLELGCGPNQKAQFLQGHHQIKSPAIFAGLLPFPQLRSDQFAALAVLAFSAFSDLLSVDGAVAAPSPRVSRTFPLIPLISINGPPLPICE